MAWSGGSKILLCLGLFLVAGSFCSCSPLKRLKALDTSKYKWTFSRGQAGGGGLHHGRLLIGPSSQQNAKGMRSSEGMNIDADYQADMGWEEPHQALVRGKASSSLRSDNEAMERLLKLEPKVECTGDSMRLRIQDGDSTPGSLFFVDRGGMQSPLPLTKLPQSCGYTIRSSRRDFVLAAPYDGCFVAHEEDCYTLPLRWCGVPVRMSCPLVRPSAPNPPMVTCHAEGMVVKTDWKVSVAKMKVYLSGKWEPLKMAAARCRFSVVAHPEGVVISVHYAHCLEKMDDLYTLQLAGEGETNISCPSLSTTPGSTQSPPNNPETPTEMPSKGGPDPNTQPSDTSGSGSTRPESGGHQVQVFPQNPEVPNQGTMETGQPQNPWYYHFPYAYPNDKPVTTAQPLTFPLTKTTNLPFQPTMPPSHVWPSQRPNVPKGEGPKEETPGKSPGAQIPYYFPYHYFNPQNFIPGQKPQLPPAPPTVQPTQGQRTQQPPKSENPATRPPVTEPPPPAVTNPPPGPTLPAVPPQVQPKGETPGESPVAQPPYYFPYHYLNPQNFNPGQKPQLPPAVQPAKGQGQLIYHPFPWTQQPPKSKNPATQPPVTEPPPPVTEPPPPVTNPPPGPTLPPVPPTNPQEPQVPPKAPVSQGQMHQFYQYPFMHPWFQAPYQTQMPPMQQPVTPAPTGKVNPTNPELPATPNKASPGKAPPQPQAPGQFYQYLYPHPAEGPNPHQQPSQPDAPARQIPQQFQPYFFYNPQPGQPPVEKPQHATTPPQIPEEPGAETPTEEPGAETPSEKPASSKPPVAVNPPSKGQMFYYLNPYYPTQPPPTTLPPITTTRTTQTTTAAQPGKGNGGNVPAGQQPGSPHRPPFYCPQVCPPGISNCCPQIAFHQHLHHFIPPGHGSKNFVPVMPFLHSGGFPGFDNGPSDPPPEPTVAATTAETTTTTAATTLAQSLPPGGIDTMPFPTKQWPSYPYILPYPYGPHSLPQSRSSVGNGEVNPIGSHYIQHPVPQMSQLFAENMKNPSWPDSMTLLAPQQLTKSQMQPTAKVKQLVHVKSGDIHMHPPADYVNDRFPAPHLRAQDARLTSPSQPFVSVSEKFPNNQNIQPRAESGWDRQKSDKNLDPEKVLLSQSLWRPFQHSDPPQDKPSGSASWPVHASAKEPQFGWAPEEPLNAEFLQSLKNVWNLGVPLDSDRFPPRVAEEEFPGWHGDASTRWTESKDPEVSEA